MGKKSKTKSSDAPSKRAIQPAPKAGQTVEGVLVPSMNTTKPRQRSAKNPPQSPGFTREDIALRAYFISEKRRTAGLPGDEPGDWIVAERQLLSESSAAKPA